MSFFSKYVFRNYVKEKISQVHDAIEYPTKHPYTQLKIDASQTTVEFIKTNCPRVVSCRSPRQLLNLALSHIALENGLFLEFGVFKGASLRYIAEKNPDARVHGFDSFEGLPEAWVHNPKGSFSVDGKLPKVPKNVLLWKGYFDATLPVWVNDHEGNLAFLHVDCDLKSSTQTIFEHLAERIVPGTVILFDDYFNFPCWELDGHAVFQSFIGDQGWKIEYLGYGFKELAVKVS